MTKAELRLLAYIASKGSAPVQRVPMGKRTFTDAAISAATRDATSVACDQVDKNKSLDAKHTT